ncbi:response regulator transcription factor [Pseudidiomarina sp. 1APP75-32.1]|uniref:Response regulator transcription factor n=1 Tax=Pseudidiomarina terrestris TaxID=2820060 RepID=A0AAW7R0X9_9GAMM|nr:response regulator transcription factor [Pseudidiomarina sp. 1APP75-32.1]MDN7125684.1 response regulator transcription factor [Pseudidiomarina sp. 1APP75-32.1]
MTQHYLLLIEDDVPLARLTSAFLTQQGFQVDHFVSIEDALQGALRKSYDLIICDIMLPGLSGFNGAPRLQAQFNSPLLFLTALTDDIHQIRGLESGACDYITKPVKPELLAAKVKANLRKSTATVSDTFSIGELTFERHAQRLRWPGGEKSFTTKDFNLLWVFALNCNQILTREYLFEQAVGRVYDGLDRAIDLKVSRLRKHLNDCQIPGLDLATIHGEGYRLNYKLQVSQ